MILVAGGKGTRLGFPYPKGVFPIGPLSGASLFQLHVEKLLARSKQAGVSIPLCLMTSRLQMFRLAAFSRLMIILGSPPGSFTFSSKERCPQCPWRMGEFFLPESIALRLVRMATVACCGPWCAPGFWHG